MKKIVISWIITITLLVNGSHENLREASSHTNTYRQPDYREPIIQQGERDQNNECGCCTRTAIACCQPESEFFHIDAHGDGESDCIAFCVISCALQAVGPALYGAGAPLSIVASASSSTCAIGAMCMRNGIERCREYQQR